MRPPRWSQRVCELDGHVDVFHRRSCTHVWADVGLFTSAATALFRSLDAIIIHAVCCVFMWLNKSLSCFAAQTQLNFAHDFFLVNITWLKSKVILNNRWWSASRDKLFAFCCPRHLIFVFDSLLLVLEPSFDLEETSSCAVQEHLCYLTTCGHVVRWLIREHLILLWILLAYSVSVNHIHLIVVIKLSLRLKLD